jgi:5-methyltetrahydropteroyltriglutamate--homocysteine methyltransferase
VIKLGQKAVAELGNESILIVKSSSCLHTPITLANKHKLKLVEKDWFSSFALEKAAKVATIAIVFSDS